MEDARKRLDIWFAKFAKASEGGREEFAALLDAYSQQVADAAYLRVVRYIEERERDHRKTVAHLNRQHSYDISHELDAQAHEDEKIARDVRDMMTVKVDRKPLNET